MRDTITIRDEDVKIRKEQPPPTKVHNPKKEYKRISQADLWEQALEDEDYVDDFV
jgi:hypothetical protein